MSFKQFAKKIFNTAKNIKHIFKYGGVTNVTISEINYGSIFTSDDVILVSGGSKGIGFSIASKCLKEGATVIVTGRNAAKLKELVLNVNNERFWAFELDISESDTIENKIIEIEKNVGKPITALINNAGVYSETHFPNVTELDAMKVFSTNATGTLMLSQVMCKLWEHNNTSKVKKIINISSQGGFCGANNAYRMTKWGIRGLTSFMGQTLCSKNIIVNAVAPGIILTDMQPEFQKQGDNLYTDLNPIKRIAIPNEIAELVVFLLSDAANFIVGQTICCDGGYSLK